MSRTETVEKDRADDSHVQESSLKVLLIEDNPGDVQLMKEMLRGSDNTRFNVVTAARLQEGVAKIEKESPDVVLLDLGLPDSFGLKTLEDILHSAAKLPVVVLTGHSDEAVGLQAVAMGAQDYLVKDNVNEVMLERSLKHSIQRNKMMEELKESNERYVSLFQENHAVMLLVDPVDGKVVDVNQAAVDFLGYPKEVLLGTNITELLVLPSDKVFDILGKSLAGVQRQFEFQLRLVDKRIRDAEVFAGPLHIKGKSYLYAIIHDITARKLAEAERARLVQEVAEQGALLQIVIDNAPSGICVVSGHDLKIMSSNDAFSKQVNTGGRKGPLVGRRLEDLTSNLVGVMMENVRTAIRTGDPAIDVEIETTSERGPPAAFYLSTIPIMLKGNEKGAMIQLTDVTEIVRARRRIEEMAARSDSERRRIKAVLDNLPVGVFVVDKNGRTVEKNENMDVIWGGRFPSPSSISEYKELKGWWADTGIIVRPEEWPISIAVKKGEAVVGAVVDIQRFDGTRGTILTSASPIRDSDGKTVGAVSVIQDITRQRKLEHDAIDAKEQAELYIDLLSHDISNMNAAVMSYLESALEKMDIEQKNRQYFIKPQEILETSNRLIENVRKIQQIETHEGKHGLVDLGWLIEDVRSEFEHYPGHEVKITYKTAIKKFVISSDLLRDVFYNLISNAIKHSTGPVEISIILTKVFEGGREHYKVTVEDDGPGIPDELKSKLFQRKQRGRTKTTGTGLGLYLVKKLVEDVNGRVWVEDRIVGDHTKGARFVVLLPVASPEGKSVI